MRFLKDGREYVRDEERGGWKWSLDSGSEGPCGPETCAMLDEIMRLYKELRKTPEERECRNPECACREEPL